MKEFKILVLTIVLCLFTTQVEAQIHYGLKVGLNSTFAKSELEQLEHDSKLGYQIGGIIKIDTKSKFHFNIEPTYTNNKFSSTWSLTKTNIDLRYISVPVIISYTLVPKLSAGIGPEIKISTNSKKSNFDPIDMGIHGGINFEAFKNISFSCSGFFGVKYNQEYSDFFNIDVADILPGNGLYRLTSIALEMKYQLR